MIVWILIVTSAASIGGAIGGAIITYSALGRGWRKNSQEPSEASQETVEARLKRLGFETSELLYFTDHQENVADSAWLNFLPVWRPLFKADGRGIMQCRKCLTPVTYVRFTGSELYTSAKELFPAPLERNVLGIFCLRCSVGSWSPPGLFPRRTTLKERLDDFEKRVAFYKLARRSQEDQSGTDTSFIATVEGTGGLRQPPLRVRVDPDTKTVRPLEVEPEPAEAETDDRARDATQKVRLN